MTEPPTARSVSQADQNPAPPPGEINMTSPTRETPESPDQTIRTLQAQLEEALEREHFLSCTLERTQRIGRLGYWQASLATDELFWSDMVFEIFGLCPGEVQPTIEEFKRRVHPDDLAKVEASEECARHTGLYDVVHRILLPDGSVRWVHEMADMQPDHDTQSLIGTVRDITEQKELEEKLRTRSLTDELTGLNNRRYFNRRLAALFNQFTRTDTPLTLVLVDVDHFKQINDQHGHQSGDHALQALAELMRDRLRGMDVPCRVGGDEFAILLPETPLVGAEAVGEEIRHHFEDLQIQFRGAPELHTTLSVGVDGFRPGDTSEEAAVTRADRALYKSKVDGRNRVTVGHPESDRIPSAEESA